MSGKIYLPRRSIINRLFVINFRNENRIAFFDRQLLKTNRMKSYSIFFCLIAFVVPALGQKPDEVLATATGLNFTARNLSADGRKLFENQNAVIAEARTSVFTQMLADLLLEMEARSQNTSPEALATAEFKKISNPTDAEIKAIYDANRSTLGGKSIEDVRAQIIAFLRRPPEQKAAQALIEKLKVKYKTVMGKDVNAPDLKPSDSLGTVNGRTISAQEFEEKNKVALYDTRSEIADNIRLDLAAAVFSELVNQEAKAKNTDAGSIIAAEITYKLSEFSDAERSELISSFQNRLFKKYAVKLLLKEPELLVQNISSDDDPAQGKQNAPVTVIMFSDFQCSACAGAHPLLKNVLIEYGDRVRFIVRDFPLTSIHTNAFQAALAANAANAQGKFFEYIDVLYRNQEALDSNSLKKYAADLGLNVKRFALDLASEKMAVEVRKDMADGIKYGIQGTPTIFVNGVKVRRLSGDDFRSAIEKAVKK